MQSKDGRINILTKNMINSFDNSSYSIFTDPSLALKVSNSIKAMNWCHTMLIICEGDQVKDIPKISDNLKFLSNVSITYQKPLNRQIGYLSSIAFLYNNGHAVDWKATEWFNPEAGRSTNHWDLSQNNSFMYNKFPVNIKEPERIKYGEISLDVILLLHSISIPTAYDRFIYQGIPSDSILKFVKEVFKCTVYVDNNLEQIRLLKKYENICKE